MRLAVIFTLLLTGVGSFLVGSWVAYECRVPESAGLGKPPHITPIPYPPTPEPLGSQ